MKIYFHTNNKATRDALQKCGVRNVFISFKYSHDISTFSDCFENIFISTNSRTDKEKYYDEIRKFKGEKVELLINDKQNNPEIVKIKPWNKAEDGEQKRYSLGFYVLEIEKDEFFLKLIDKYKKISKKK